MPDAGSIRALPAQSRALALLDKPIVPPAIAILITRPQPQADRLAADLRAALGAAVNLIVSPLMETRFPAVELPAGRFEALILTSEAGAEAAGRLRQAGQTLPIRALCVGNRTAKVAQSYGFEAEILGPTADALVQAVVANRPTGPLLYLRGRDISADIETELTAQGIQTVSAIVYEQAALPLPPTALAQSGPIILPLFSTRSARLVFDSLPVGMTAHLHPCLIAENLLAAVPLALHPQTTVADRPDGKAMHAAILRVISSLSP